MTFSHYAVFILFLRSFSFFILDRSAVQSFSSLFFSVLYISIVIVHLSDRNIAIKIRSLYLVLSRNFSFVLRNSSHTSCKHDEKLLDYFLIFTFNSAEN